MSVSPCKFPDRLDAGVPGGFSLRQIEVFDKDRLKRIGLVLPVNDDIDQWLLQHAENVKSQAAQFENAELERRLARRQAGETGTASPTMPASTLTKVTSSSRAYQEARSALKADHDGMASELSQIAQSGVAMVRLYAWDEPLKLLSQTGPLTANRHLSERDQGLFEKLKDLGAFRTIGHRDTYAATLSALSELSLLHPQFGEVIDFVKARMVLARETTSPLALPPILLIGPPGVGKTHFTLALAKAMQRPVERHSFDSDHTNSALTGSDRHWSNTKTGLLFDTLCLGERADPIILLDELDKADAMGRGNPLQPLLSLLEPVTARDVVDISVGIRFDASHVFWIATANELQCVPVPIQSRFRIFNLQAPSAGQALDLARAVARSVQQRFPAFEAPLRDLALLVAHLTPREQIQALEQAFASAAANGRKHLVQQDLPGVVLNDLGEDLVRSPLLH